MGILHVTKKKVPEVLTRRLLQQLKMRDSAGLEHLDLEGQQNLSEGVSGDVHVTVLSEPMHDVIIVCGRVKLV